MVYTTISLLSNKIKVLIVGGGRAAYIKAKSFVEKGCHLTVVATEFHSNFQRIKDLQNIKLIENIYLEEYILDKQLVVIATGNEILNNRIREDCEIRYKLYLDCKDFKEGNFISTVQRETKNISFSINTKKSAPKGAVFLAEKIKGELLNYDDFMEYIFNIREKIKSKSFKDNMIEFICSEDFYCFYNKGASNKILKMFYGEWEDNANA